MNGKVFFICLAGMKLSETGMAGKGGFFTIIRDASHSEKYTGSRRSLINIKIEEEIFTQPETVLQH